MAKSIVVYGVPGGKTRFAKRIADHFGLTLATQSFEDAGLIFPFGRLYLSQNELEPTNYKLHLRSFQEVADEINASIPLTDWQSGPPPMVGEWNASWGHNVKTRRWWNGDVWSFAFEEIFPQEEKNCNASQRYPFNDIEWRGLSQEPIKVTE